MTTYSGKRNPNYKHGRACSDSTCSCGRKKDFRATRCAVCSRRSISKTGERLVTDEEITSAVQQSTSLLQVAKSLQVSRQTVTRAVDRLALDLSHFRAGRGRPRPDEQFFRAGSDKRVAVRKRFLALGVVDYKCALCENRGEWRGETLTLETDHINGDRGDNRVENLRWLCPNCHTQQPTCRGKNYHKYKRKEPDE